MDNNSKLRLVDVDGEEAAKPLHIPRKAQKSKFRSVGEIAIFGGGLLS